MAKDSRLGTSIEDFSRIVEEMGEERRKKDEAAVALFESKEEAAARRRWLDEASDRELLDGWLLYLGHTANHKLMSLRYEFATRVKSEILRRMARG